MSIEKDRLFDDVYLRENSFEVLSEVGCLLATKENMGRDLLIKLLENREAFSDYYPFFTTLVQRAGLYPYIFEDELRVMPTSDLIAYEFHRPEGMDDIVLHSTQGKVYRALMDGQSVVLSAPTSFGKSLLIDVMIASGKFRSVVIIVPTIALIDETRRRLTERFSADYKIITHPDQARGDRNVYVLTQERYVEFSEKIQADFFVIDEFYKLGSKKKDERTFVLNHTFYQLFKTGAQFFMIGPNVQNIAIDEEELDFRFFKTDFSTVSTEIVYFSPEPSIEEQAVNICLRETDSTLLFCKSANSAYKLAFQMLESGVGEKNENNAALSEWLAKNYHPEWLLTLLIENGIAVHHGALPRSIAQFILRKFNDGDIKYLLCTSTIIEGVNTSAKNIIIYDNKIALSKFDYFTFNNIKGRAGRMFKHFVGRIYVMNDEPQQELPFIDIPSFTQPEDLPESLLLNMEHSDLTDASKERLKYLHAQDYLPVDVIQNNIGVSATTQLYIAKEITDNIQHYAPLLSWTRFPRYEELLTACELIFDFVPATARGRIHSAKQFVFKINSLIRHKNIQRIIYNECENSRCESPTQAVEDTLSFMRNWAEHNFPRYMRVLDQIQRHVLTTHGKRAGNYELICSQVKHWFMPLSATILEEYGVPFQISLKVEGKYELGDTVDEILTNLKEVDVAELGLNEFESGLLIDAINGM